MNKLKNTKKGILILSILLLFLVIGAASAADDKISEDDLSAPTDSVDEVASVDNDEKVSTAEDTLGSKDTNSTLSNSNNEIIKEGEYKSLSELSTLIRVSPNKLDVTEDYQYTDSTLEIIKNNYVVDFGGHVIDGNGFSGDLLTVSGSNVTIKNLKIVNCNGFAISWSGSDGVLDNFDLSQSNRALSWSGINGEVKNSVIHNMQCTTTSLIYIGGGATDFKLTNTEIKDFTKDVSSGNTHIISSGPSSTLSKVKFTNIDTIGYTSSKFGSYMIYQGSSDLVVEDCDFINCTYNLMIALSTTNARISNIRMIGCHADNGRGMIMCYSSALNYEVTDCQFINCSHCGISGEWCVFVMVNNPTGSISNCLFENCTNAYACVNLNGAVATNCTFKNNNIGIGAINTLTSTGAKIVDCTFINNTGFNHAGGINLDKQGIVENCTLINNTGALGGAIYIKEPLSIVSSSTFINNTSPLGNSIYSQPNLNIRINNTGNKWNTSYDVDVYAPGCYDNISTYLYVNQTGGGDGLNESNPTDLDSALKLIGAGGTIEFVNNNQVYEDISVMIPKAVTLIGNGVTITTKNKPYVFSIGDTGNGVNNVEINNFKFIDCITTDNSYGSTIFIRGTYDKITDCEFINCQGVNAGGIYTHYSTGTVATIETIVSGCNFTENTATNNGSAGAVSFRSNNGKITDCKFNNNEGVLVGAVSIQNYNGKHDITYCSFIGNNATGTSGNSVGALCLLTGVSPRVLYCNFTNNKGLNQGGGIYSNRNGLEMAYCDFTGNTANNYGGAAILYSGTVYNCTFTSNQARYGGGLFLNGNGAISNCSFISNTAYSNGYGGAIGTNNGNGVFDYSISNCEFIGNTNRVFSLVNNNGVVVDCNFTGNSGTVISATGSSGSLEVSNCNFTGNNGNDGSAINTQSKTTIKGSNFIDNNATNHGGALYINSSLCSIEGNSIFKNNTAVEGGAIYNVGDDLQIKDSTFTYNNATNGGAILTLGNSMLVIDSVLTNNYATNHGGAIYINETLSYYVDVNTQRLFKDNKCLNHTLMPTNKNWDNIYDQGTLTLLEKVYVVYDPTNWIYNGEVSSDTGESWENATTFKNALSVVAPNGIIIFVNGTGEIYNYTVLTDYTTNIIDLKLGVTVQGNNTTFVGFYFTVNNDNVNLQNLKFINYLTSPVVWSGVNGVINNCTFKDNGGVTSTLGAAVNVEGADLQIINSTFINNRAENNNAQGGALFINSTGTVISGCTFDSNVCNDGSHIMLTSNSEFIKITASSFNNGYGSDQSGSGIYVQSSVDVQILDCNFTNNYILNYERYSNDGGAIHVGGTAYVIITGNRFKNNTASNGGAISFTEGSTLVTVDNNNFIENNAYTNGGALIITNTGFNSFSGNTFTGNKVTNGNGGWWCNLY